MIDELGIMREEEVVLHYYSPDDARYEARFLSLIHMARFLGRAEAPCEEALRAKVSRFKRLPSAEEWLGKKLMRMIPADENNPGAKKLMPMVDEDVLPPRWQKKRKTVWEAETPLGTITYEWSIELRRDTYPRFVIWVDNGPQGAVYPDWLFSIAQPYDSFIFDDLDDFERRYRAFLTLLNVFIDELRELGERYVATGRFD